MSIDLPREEVAAFCKRWRVIELALFGSVLRDDFAPGSDIDVLVTFADGANWSLFDHMEMQDQLEAMFGREVDLVMKKAITNPFRRHHILRNQEVVYAA